MYLYVSNCKNMWKWLDVTLKNVNVNVQSALSMCEILPPAADL